LDVHAAERALAVRNSIVHGFEASGLDERITEELTDLSHRLVAELCQSSPSCGPGAGSPAQRP